MAEDDPNKPNSGGTDDLGEPILEPEEDYELHGEVNEVVFATGLCEIEDEYYIYYGAADKVICGATVETKALLSLF